ncbi:uncharacterized protein LOC126417080 [Schistocerca serialis cubense]|uniref:uncharacterized protein LOC126417080 n=1 Tax=Schistocerca serialis cubense TaxID=2023355 RepID=UPI00214E9C5B|nr:uncharacterized protein LOC126417080 [Schistocerca serialis cubense]
MFVWAHDEAESIVGTCQIDRQLPQRSLRAPTGHCARPPRPPAARSLAEQRATAGPCRGPRTHQPPPPPPPPPGANSSSHDGAQLRRKPVARPPPPANAHSAPAPINSGRFASRGTGPPPTTSHLHACSPWPPQQAVSLATRCLGEVIHVEVGEKRTSEVMSPPAEGGPPCAAYAA